MKELWRGFVKTRNKKCVEKFKDRNDLMNLEQAQQLDEYAGILAENIVLVDFDDETHAKIAMDIVKEEQLECVAIKTSRGVHIYFKSNEHTQNCRTGASLACGLKADIKLGSRNSYAICKFNGVEREVIYQTEKLDEIPPYFIPMKTNVDFVNMENGDGRNQTLYNHILTLQSLGLSKENIRLVLEIANDFVFDEPLSHSELEIIGRDEAFQKDSFFDGSTLAFEKFSRFLISECHIIKLNGQLYVYKDGVYVQGHKFIEAAMIKFIPRLTKAKRTEILEYIELIMTDEAEPAPSNLIAFKNGIYDIVQDKMLPFDPKHIITNKINFDYNPNAKSDLVKNTMRKISCNNEDIIMLLYEVAGYCLFRKSEMSKSFILTGSGANGKSTYLDMIRTMLGANNISSLDLSELCSEFKNSTIVGKLANIGDDISGNFIPDVSIFKKLCTGEAITFNEKFKNPYQSESYAKLLFSANEVPRMGKGRDSYAIKRRVVLVPFKARFTKDDPDYSPFIKYELREPENIEYLIKMAVEGLKCVLENKEFTTCDAVEQEMEEYENQNNSVVSFLNNGDVKIENESVGEVYLAYSVYCRESNLQALSKIAFSKEIQKQANVTSRTTSVAGRSIRIFVKN